MTKCRVGVGTGAAEDLLIRGAHVLDPTSGLDDITDVRLSDGCIAEVGEGLRGTRILDADGLCLFPGFVDVHAHWRTPGREDEETIETGSEAAAAYAFLTDQILRLAYVLLELRRIFPHSLQCPELHP